MKATAIFGTALLFFAGPYAIAQQSSAGSSASPSMQMHQDMMKGAKQSMAMKPSGDVDQDFVKMMRHHHQMGVQMAQHEVDNGKDEKAKEMARKIVEDQKKEIKDFDAWLESRGTAKKPG